ncbi:MAG: glycosyltransferase [Nitrososphaerota archaeon]|jgi:glycosyltransferase involved in cell wall biosynthesis|nr:glycosyltransferase [Nitrososphaerota archaeon]
MNSQIAQNHQLFKKTVKKAICALDRDDLIAAVTWAKIAAHFASIRHPGIYANPDLENLLLEVAHRIDQNPPDVSGAFYLKAKPRNLGKMRFLHVITESYDTGGHSPFVSRWIENTLENSVHSIITTAQNSTLPLILQNAVDKSGGWYCSLIELSPNLMEQALLLRLLSRNWADAIVLFVHPFDPLPLVAFGIQGGPPIILCNHADHVFWLGSAIADVTVDYHCSATKIAINRRGIRAAKLLPIPLPKPCSVSYSLELRAQLGFDAKDVVLLTVGRAEKFYPFGGYDFLNVMVGFLKEHPAVKLIATGPRCEGRWAKASVMVEGRVQALGPVERQVLENYYRVADVYVAGFPCGSGTALLEAVMHNLPIVGLHLGELPHLSLEDDVGFNELRVHQASLADFLQSLEFAVLNCRSSQQRAQVEAIRRNVEREHCAPGWNGYLDAVLQALPSQHSVYAPQILNHETDYTDVYWEAQSAQMLSNELPQHSLNRLVRTYGRYLSKPEILGAQAENLRLAFLNMNNFQKTKQFILDLKAFACCIFSNQNNN